MSYVKIEYIKMENPLSFFPTPPHRPLKREGEKIIAPVNVDGYLWFFVIWSRILLIQRERKEAQVEQKVF